MVDRTFLNRPALGLFFGPALALLILLLPQPTGLSAEGQAVGAVAVWMAVWWVSEAVPLAATALLPIVLFPLLGVMPTAKVTLSYANHLIYLFLGGFLIAVTMEKWNLHRRIALHTISLVGVSPPRMVLGFMLSTAFLSMWISNTATAMMMLPIGIAVIRQVEELAGDGDDARSGFGCALMLGIAYAASIGGVATLIGTPPNAILAGVFEKTYGQSISFAAWMGFGLPLSAVMLLVAWFYLTRVAFPSRLPAIPGAAALIHRELAGLGAVRREEKWVLAVFVLVAGGWILRGLLEVPWLKGISDASIAMAGALLLFVIPSDFAQRRFLLDWQTAVRIPWEIIVLFGGGFALAHGFSDSGLTTWTVNRLSGLSGAAILWLVLATTLLVIFLTEVTSNTATATLVLPIMGALAQAVDVHPLALMVPAAVAASYAFMLPVATPPNAIVFSSGFLTIPQMARAGVWLNLIASVLITVFVLWLLPILWGLRLQGFPF